MTEKLVGFLPIALSVEGTWSIFKTSLTDVLIKTCGTKKTGKVPVKRMQWWNDTVKEATKEKKKLYKIWIKSRLEEDYIKYQQATEVLIKKNTSV